MSKKGLTRLQVSLCIRQNENSVEWPKYKMEGEVTSKVTVSQGQYLGLISG